MQAVMNPTTVISPKISEKNFQKKTCQVDYFSALICRYDMSSTTNRKIMHDPVS